MRLPAVRLRWRRTRRTHEPHYVVIRVVEGQGPLVFFAGEHDLMGRGNSAAVFVARHDGDVAPLIPRKFDPFDEVDDDESTGMRRLDSQMQLRMRGVACH